MKNTEIPKNIKEVDDSITNQIIECAHSSDTCTNAFRVTKEEIKFYKQMNLLLPKYCPNCRHEKRLKMRNPMKLLSRECMCYKKNHHNHPNKKCDEKFETTYSLDRPEIVYCEKCYQQEVY